MSGNTSENKGLGGAAPDWYAAGLDHIWLPYAQMKTATPPLAVKATHGSRIVLADGRELIDGIASWWTACHGYNHPHIRAAVERQLATLPHVMFGGMVHEPALTLARRLAAMLSQEPQTDNLDRVFFSDSGSVAVEVALKMAVQYWLNKGVAGAHPDRRFQGRLSRRHYRRDGGVRSAERFSCARLPGFCRNRSSPICQSMKKARRRSKPCWRSGPARSPRSLSSLWCRAPAACTFTMPKVLRTLRALADRYELLLIFDEIFTGFFRTGAMFAFQQAGVVPDIVTLSKALTGGTLAAGRHHRAARKSSRRSGRTIRPRR